MAFIEFLVAFPLVVAAVCLIVRDQRTRTFVVVASALTIAFISVWFTAAHIKDGFVSLDFSSVAIDALCSIVSVALAAVVVAFAIRWRNIPALVLAIVQLVASLAFELGPARGVEVAQGLHYDQLSFLMVLIIGVVGSAICVYALGYMEDFQAHEPAGSRDRRPTFFAVMFLFLSGMYVIVLSDNLSWMFSGWEVTTVCSFLLIGFTRTDEAMMSAFRQIIMNILGGLGFLGAMWASALGMGTLSFSGLLQEGVASPELALLPTCLLAFAGLTKAAQMPFHTWLLGAMVAPTPTSALLHSSTMVKAGVFLLIRLAPLFAVCAPARWMVLLTGGITFLLCSCMAISQSNAKRVLAYSTISNLGLITVCAGVGTAEAVWAAMFLILFHAIAKSLLFLCVGTAEHHIGSRDIEDMDLLFERMPRLSRLMMLGIMCMFVAPLGMLVAKWATLVSLVETDNVVLVVILCFGSAVTFMFWAKWFGKLSAIAPVEKSEEIGVHSSEWAPLLLMATLIVACCVSMPLISRVLVEPYLLGMFGYAQPAIASDNLAISAILSAVVFIVLLAGVGRAPKRQSGVYLSGISADNAARKFRCSTGDVSLASQRNWYMEQIFGERRLTMPGSVFCGTLMACAILVSSAPLLALA